MRALFVLSFITLACAGISTLQAESVDSIGSGLSEPVRPSNHADSSLLSPAGSGQAPVLGGQEARTIDGFGNNVANPTWGSAGIQHLRLSTPSYGDGASTPAGALRPGARVISNTLCAQAGSTVNPMSATDFVWQWGQFLDHDLDLAEIAEPHEAFDIPVPMGDEFFDPKATGTQTIALDRAAYDLSTGTGPGNPREQMNFITAYIDASNVYGSDVVRADALRVLDGSGKLKTSAGDLLPFNTDGLPNAGGPSPTLFLAGDVRANEQVGLTSMHTLFVREHNRLCDEIALEDPLADGEEIYQRARSIVGAQMQVITYKEFLPILIGDSAIPPYGGYDPGVNVGISNVFATACYRLGHSMLSSTILRLNGSMEEVVDGHLSLRDAFFSPSRLTDEGGIAPILRGLSSQQMQTIDCLVVDDVRNFLFGKPGSGGFDLASLNIQRGRDHGLADYNQTRVDFGLPPVTSFSQITSNPFMSANLEGVYGDVNDIDIWIGALAEDRIPGTLVGELLRTVLVDQFTRLRDGDRFWYEGMFTAEEIQELESTTLADIIRRNTEIGDEIQDNVFMLPQGAAVPVVETWGIVLMALCITAVGTIVVSRRRLV